MLHHLFIRGWHPSYLNQLTGNRFKSARLKAADRETVARHVMVAALPKATSPRLVQMHLIMPPKARRPDRDALYKTTLDALKACKMLVNDSPDWCHHEEPTYSRALDDTWGTIITLEDLE